MPGPNYPAVPEELDDVDRLFARLDRAPVPAALTARVLASTVARSSATRTVLAWPWMIAVVAAFALLSLAGYQIGASMAARNGPELVVTLFDDPGPFAYA